MMEVSEVVSTESPPDIGREAANSHWLYLGQTVKPKYYPLAEIISTMLLVTSGLVGNTMILAVLRHFKNKAVFLYLRVLAACDLTLSAAMLCGVIHMMMGAMTTIYLWEWLFTYIAFPAILITPALSSCVTLVICLTRYTMVKWPLKAKLCANLSVAKCILLLNLVVVILFRAPVIYMGLGIRSAELFTPGETTYYQMFWNEWFFSDVAQALWLASAAVFEQAMTIVMGLVSFLMLFTLRKQNVKMAQLKKSTSSQSQETERQLVHLVTTIVVLHTLCQAPMSLVRWLPLSRQVKQVVIAVCNQLLLFNHAFNFWMYLLNHSWFRVKTKQLLGRVFKRTSGGQTNSTFPSTIQVQPSNPTAPTHCTIPTTIQVQPMNSESQP